jgi:hypothetical protein
MPGTDDLREFIEERLIAWDPDIDLTDGSPAQIEIVEPLVERFAIDPFEMDVATFIQARLRQEYPDLNVEHGDALADFLAKPMEALLDPLIREVTFLRQNKSLASPELLAPAEADSLMGNLFIRRITGNYSTGKVRLYFNAPTSVSISVGNTASTDDGLNYTPTTPQEISAEAMLFNQDGNLFYFDVSFQAESEGDAYNVEAGSITSIANVPSAVRVTNLSRFRDGLPAETTLSFLDRGESSLTERSLVVPRGALARLLDQFGDLQHLQVVGFQDSEMQRDIIKGGGLGEVVMYGDDGFTGDDGDGDGFATSFFIPTSLFTTSIGPVGPVENFVLTAKGEDFIVTEVISGKIIKIARMPDPTLPPGEPLPPPNLSDNLTNVEYYIRRSVLTLSSLPGGVIGQNGVNGTLELHNDEIHVGGRSDFYVRGTSLEKSSLVVESVSDDTPLVSGTDLETLRGGIPADVVYFSNITVTDADKVKKGMSLVIINGGDAGTYQIVKPYISAYGHKYMQVDPPLTNPATNLTYKIVDKIDVNLNEPKTVRGSGTDLKTVLGSSQVSTVSSVDFDALGGEVGDILRISSEGLNKGDRQVKAITGTGNNLLTFESELKKTSSSEAWSLFKLGDGIQAPVVRVKSVDILDSSNQPTGDIIPYADPVDIQSFSFSNIGIGEKKVVGDARIGILGSVDLDVSPTSVNGKTLNVSLNGGSFTAVNFSGVVTARDIVTQINAILAGYNIAELYDVEGELRLSLRSRNNWIVVNTLGSANADLGLSLAENEDNRQIISDSVPDWTVLGLEAEKDSVYILTGDNAEFWHLHSVATSKLLVARVDLDGRSVFPLTDESANVRVGSRSFGKVRCYFIDPTSFEVHGNYRRAAKNTTDHPPNLNFGWPIWEDEISRTEFFLDLYGDATAYMRFFPDPALRHTVHPAVGETIANNLNIAAANDFFVESEGSPTVGIGKYSRGSEVDFLLREVVPGDILEITYQPMQGSVDVRATPSGAVDYVAGDVLGKTLVFSLDNGPSKTVTFTSSVDSPARLVSEINQQLGATIAFEEDTGTAVYLRIEADFAVVIKSSGTAMALLGMTAGNNDANAKGEYKISDVGYITGATSNHMRLATTGPVGYAGVWTGFAAGEVGPSQHFKIHRPGVQRIGATEMAENVENGLYYFDVELVSFGPGDEFNIEPNLQLEAENFISDGYRILAPDENLTFSEHEELLMEISRRILTVGATDAPSNMTQISQQNIQVNYDRSPLVSQVQAFADSDLERVLCADILVRHLVPHFVQLELFYVGGSSAAIVEGDVTDLIDSLLPNDVLEAAAITNIPQRRGATRVTSPVMLIGVVHRTDRKVRVVRSEDAITSGRLTTFLVGGLTVTRESP